MSAKDRGAPLVTLAGVTVGHRRRPLLTGLDLAVHGGETMAVVGPNGAGKTTLVGTVLGTLRPLCGTVRRRAGLTVGLVPQRCHHEHGLELEVREVVATGGLGLARGGVARWSLAARKRVEAVLRRLGLGELAGRSFVELSGGQQQRVLIARALVREPDLLVLDEPTAGLDLAATADLMGIVTSLARERGLGVVFVTHELPLARDHADRTVFINHERGLFLVGPTRELVVPEILARFYGRPVEVAR